MISEALSMLTIQKNLLNFNSCMQLSFHKGELLYKKVVWLEESFIEESKENNMYSLMGRILHTSQREKNIEIHIILQISL
jgi:hypothetical protein